MLWVRESLLMKVTWPPALIVTVLGVTPLDAMVIVAPGEAGVPGSGDVGAEELEPEQAAVQSPTARGARTARNLVKTTLF
jgi:hypothetical protein